MMPLRRPHRVLLALAFTASLLLSLVPTIGRLHRALDADGALLDAHAFCTTQGLAYRSADTVGDAFAGIADPKPQPRRGDPAPDGDDCAYCPLLATTGLPAMVVSLPPRLPPLAVSFASRPQPALRDRHLLGWAPRGPPMRRA